MKNMKIDLRPKYVVHIDNIIEVYNQTYKGEFKPIDVTDLIPESNELNYLFKPNMEELNEAILDADWEYVEELSMKLRVFDLIAKTNGIDLLDCIIVEVDY